MRRETAEQPHPGLGAMPVPPCSELLPGSGAGLGVRGPELSPMSGAGSGAVPGLRGRVRGCPRGLELSPGSGAGLRRFPELPRLSPAPVDGDPGAGSCPRRPLAGTGPLLGTGCTDRGHCSCSCRGPLWPWPLTSAPVMGSLWAEVS